MGAAECISVIGAVSDMCANVGGKMFYVFYHIDPKNQSFATSISCSTPR